VPKALLTHAFAYLFAGLLAAALVRFGRGVLVWSWMHVPIVTFLAGCALATAVSPDPYVAAYGTHARMLGLGTIAAWTVLYLAVVTFVRDRRDVIAIVLAMCLGTAVMLLYEAIQLLRLDPFAWNLDTATRPISTNGQPTTLGTYLLAVAMLLIAVAALGADVSRRVRILAASAALVPFFGAALTGTRSSLIGVGTGAIALAALLWSQQTGRRRWTVLGVAAATTLAVAAAIMLTPLGARLFPSTPVAAGETEENAIARLDTGSLDVRGLLYRVALDAFLDRPVLGYGPDTFVIAMAKFRPDTGPDEARLAYATSPHGWIGQVAIDAGAIGLIAFVGVGVAAAVLAFRRPAAYVGAIAFVVIATFLGAGLTTVSDVGSDWLFWIAAGILAAWSSLNAHLGPGTATRRVRRSRSDPQGWTWLFPILAVAACLTLVAPLQASRAAADSRDKRLAGQTAAAVRSALEATAQDPGRGEYWHTLGLAYVSGQRWRDADTAFTRAVAIDPWDARNISDLIQVKLIQAQAGDVTARADAVKLSSDVIRVDPNFPDAQLARATVMQFVGDYAEALKAIERALALVPTSRNDRWYVMATQVDLALGKNAEAVSIAERGLAIVPASALLRFEYARALLANGRAQEALAQVDLVLKVDPTSASANELKARITAALKP